MAKETKVTRITAKETAPKAVKKSASKEVKEKKTVKKSSGNPFLKALQSIGGYFKGAWEELRQVRWPTRRATWGLTIAVILFSAFFTVLIVLLDLLFKYLFEQLIA